MNKNSIRRRGGAAFAVLALLAVAPALIAQDGAGEPGTDNMEVIGRFHSADGLEISYTDIELE